MNSSIFEETSISNRSSFKEKAKLPEGIFKFQFWLLCPHCKKRIPIFRIFFDQPKRVLVKSSKQRLGANSEFNRNANSIFGRHYFILSIE